MFSRPPLRSGTLARARALNGVRRPFHATIRTPIQIGDRIPDIDLMEASPGNKVSIAQQLPTGQGKGKGLIIGVPAAFSPSCSERHIPGYIRGQQTGLLKDAGAVFVVSVNDPFVYVRPLSWARSGRRNRCGRERARLTRFCM